MYVVHLKYYRKRHGSSLQRVWTKKTWNNFIIKSTSRNKHQQGFVIYQLEYQSDTNANVTVPLCNKFRLKKLENSKNCNNYYRPLQLKCVRQNVITN